MRRRGPGLIGRAVVVGGAAHYGARSAQRGMAAQQQESEQNQQIAELQARPPSAPAVAPPMDDAAQIEKYATLKSQGLITEEEFDERRSRSSVSRRQGH